MKALYALLMLALALAAGAASAATITIVNTDSPNEGFNDPTPVNPVGGNPGTTIGQQRLNLFQRAADIWGGLLESEVEVRVESSFDALPCDAGSAVLGSAGPLVIPGHLVPRRPVGQAGRHGSGPGLQRHKGPLQLEHRQQCKLPDRPELVLRF